MTDEEFHDQIVGPELLRLAKLCEDRGLAFVAAAQWDQNGEFSTTKTLPAAHKLIFRYLELLTRCGTEGGNVNIDKFMMAVARDQQGKDHSSMILRMMEGPPA